jgi:amidase
MHSWVGVNAVTIARAVQRGDTSATEVMVQHLDHVRVADRVLDLLRVLRAGAALAEADRVDDQPDLGNLPLAGVPVVVGEDVPVAGARFGNGIATGDHELVRRLRGAGAVVLGTSRTGDDGPTRAITRHPWRSDRLPGVAGGGAAAAVAAGVVPVSHGVGVRIPAACCGVVGFQPGWGLVPEDHGILATTVDDVAVGFAVLAGRSPRPVREPGRLRVGVSVRCPVPLIGPDREVRAALARAARRLVGLEHDVVSAEPSYPLWLARAALALGVAARRGLVGVGEGLDWRGRCEAWFADHGLDLLALPAIPGAPPTARSSRVLSTPVAVRLAAYTAPWSLAGLPAITVPMGVRRDGTPVVVQLVGPPGAEGRLLCVAAQLERVEPWHRHAPGWPRPAKIRAVWPRPANSGPAPERDPAPVMARSGHDHAPASNGAGDPGGRRGGPQGAGRIRPRDPDGAQPAAHRRSRRSGVAQV